MKSRGLWRAFISGSSSTYHVHAKSLHFKLYEEWCKEQGIEMHWRAVPDYYYKKEQKKACMKQGTLDVVFKKMDGEVPKC